MMTDVSLTGSSCWIQLGAVLAVGNISITEDLMYRWPSGLLENAVDATREVEAGDADEVCDR